MIVFHASTVEIEKFYIPYGGLHFGGMLSAVECAMRKLYEGRAKGHDIDTIYIHRCRIAEGNEYDSIDLGSDKMWRGFDKYLKDNNFHYIKYINQFEPDIVPSYCFFELDRIQLLDVSVMHMDVAEDLLNGLYQDEYRYQY